MKVTKSNYRKLEQVLAGAYREKERGEVADHWQAGVMRRIRSMGPPKSSFFDLDMLERFVWRFAPVACALILALTVVFTRLDFLPDYEMAKMLLEDPVESTLTQILNV